MRCSHLCLPPPIGSNTLSEDFENGERKSACVCPTQHVLAPDGFSCLPPRQYLVTGLASSLQKVVDTWGDGALPPVAPIPPPLYPTPWGEPGKMFLAYNAEIGLAYWKDGNGRVWAQQEGRQMGPMPVIERGGVTSVAVDDVTLDVFAASDDVIIVARISTLNGDDYSYKSIGVAFAGVKDVRFMTIQSSLRLLFFVTSIVHRGISRRSIERCRIDGYHRRIILSKDEPWNPTALVVDSSFEPDFESTRLYWVDGDAIVSIGIDGSAKSTLFKSTDGHIISVAPLGVSLYFATKHGTLSKIPRTPILGLKHSLTVIKGLTDIVNVVAVDETSLGVRHPCAKLQCPELCFQTPPRVNISYARALRNNYQDFPHRKVVTFDTSPFDGSVVPPFSSVFSQPVSHGCGCLAGRVMHEGSCQPCDANQHFFCNTSRPMCISGHQRCDGVVHCSDGLDETNCAPPCVGSVCSTDTRPVFVTAVTPTSVSATSQTAYVVGITVAFFIILLLVVAFVYYRRHPELHNLRIVRSSSNLNKNSKSISIVSSSQSNGNIFFLRDSSKFSNRSRRSSEVFTLTPTTTSTLLPPSHLPHLRHHPASTTSSSSACQYATETANPPPTPSKLQHHWSMLPQGAYDSSLMLSCSTNGRVVSGSQPIKNYPQRDAMSYRFYKARNRPPPPTPVSTDVCDDSDACLTTTSEDDRKPRGGSLLMAQKRPQSSLHFDDTHSFYDDHYEYDSEPQPPPPTPRCDPSACSPSSPLDLEEVEEEKRHLLEQDPEPLMYMGYEPPPPSPEPIV